MHNVFTTPLAVLLQFQAILERLLVLIRVIVDPVAVGTFQADQIVL